MTTVSVRGQESELGDPHEAGPGARRARLPRMMWVCAAVAFAHCVIWAFVTPLGQTPDETAHASYVEYIAQHGALPKAGGAPLAKQFNGLGGGLDVLFGHMPYSAEGDPSWSRGQDRLLQRDLRAPGANAPGRGAAYVEGNPPLYYLLEAGPVALAGSSSVMNRMMIMRVVSAVFAAAAVAFVFLFLRELLPRVPWTWSFGALGVALLPLFAFVGGGVTPDPLLFACCAALFWLVARAFRRGLSPGLGAAIGLAALAGALTKSTTFGLLPGAAVGTLIAALRTERPRRRDAFIGLAAGAAVFALPFAFWLWSNTHLFGRGAGTTTAGFNSSAVTSHTTLRGQLSYLWQFYLPRLPFQTPWFTRFPTYPLWQTWIQGFIGRFGWHQYGFPLWLNELGLAFLLGIAALAIAGLARARAAVRRRIGELATYALMLGGLLALIGVAGYRYRVTTSFDFEQARYLLPAAALYAAVLAVAARGAGRRWGTALGAFFVTVMVGHAFAALLLTLGRYYT